MTRHKIAAPSPDDEPKQEETMPAAAPPLAAPARAIAGWLSQTEILSRKNMIQSLMGVVLKEDEHYGPSFPGDKKKALHKQGADTLMMTFQLYGEYLVDERQYPGNHRECRVTATIKRIGDGLVVAIGLGTCSTFEPKYRYRNDKRICPNCGVAAIIKGKAEYGGGWLCFEKKDGCGAKWPNGAAEIEQQVVGKVEHEDPAEYWNTILKMAKKRALVDGALSATGASDIFAQDGDEQEQRAATAAAAAVAQRQQEAERAASTAKPPPAAGAPANAKTAAPPPADLAARDEKLDAEYSGLSDAAGAGFARKVWQAFPNDQRQRFEALRAARRAVVGIKKTNPLPKADGLLTSIINDAENPNDVPAIIVALVKAAPPETDEPPY